MMADPGTAHGLIQTARGLCSARFGSAVIDAEWDKPQVGSCSSALRSAS